MLQPSSPSRWLLSTSSASWVSAAAFNRECGLYLQPGPRDGWLRGFCRSSRSCCTPAARTSLTTLPLDRILGLIAMRSQGCGQLGNRELFCWSEGMLPEGRALLNPLQIHQGAQTCRGAGALQGTHSPTLDAYVREGENRLPRPIC